MDKPEKKFKHCTRMMSNVNMMPKSPYYDEPSDNLETLTKKIKKVTISEPKENMKSSELKRKINDLVSDYEIILYSDADSITEENKKLKKDKKSFIKALKDLIN